MPVRAFRVKLPSTERYWTVVDDEYRVGDVDEFCDTFGLARCCREHDEGVRGVAGPVSEVVYNDGAGLADRR